MQRIRAVYRGMCPNCGDEISDDRLLAGLPCEECYPSGVDAIKDKSGVVVELKRRGRLGGFHWIYEMNRLLEDFSSYVREKTGIELWSAQRTWAKRLLAGESFAIVAPTGVGKTTLLQLYASYRVERSEWRVLYVVPTENLVRQVHERVSRLTNGVLAYYSSMSRRVREEVLARVKSGDYKLLIVTPAFIRKRFEILNSSKPFDLAIVDDVDSLLRDSRNIERLLELIGAPREAVELALRLVKAKRRLSLALMTSGDSRGLEIEIVEIERRLRETLSNARIGQVVMASATGRPRGVKHLLFREILGFEAGGSSDYLRNILDAVSNSSNVISEIARLVESLGSGGIVFVSQALGERYLDLIAEELKKRGVRVEKARAGSWKSILRFERGEVDVLVTIASRYGVAVRGLDAPLRVRYTLFAKTPAMRIEASKALMSPNRLLRLLIHISEEGEDWALELARVIRRELEKIDDPSIIQIALRRAGSSHGQAASIASLMSEAIDKALSWLKRTLTPGGTLRVGTVVYSNEDGVIYAYIPDALTYIQASGRASRMLNGRMTFGLSVVVDSCRDLVEALEEKASWIAQVDFKSIDSISLQDVVRLIEETRRGGSEARVNVDSVLLVVESPTKARTIAWFWGKPAKRRVGGLVVYETSARDPESGRVYLLAVASTRGHLFDLIEVDERDDMRYGVRVAGDSLTPVYSSIKRCRDCGSSFTGFESCPRCGSRSYQDSSLTIEALRKLALEVDYVVVASDPDREGEKIAWDVSLAITPYNPRVYRARFYEVTREAILKALRNLDRVDEKLVNSQIARRIVDRWIGFRLSSYLKSVYGMRWLGAGRVQTPILGWVISRYTEYKNTRGFKVCLQLETGYNLCIYTQEVEKARMLASLDKIIVSRISRKLETIHPPPPYTTDSLLSDASKILRMSVEQAMKIAQDLFESGLITYHRTDSTRVSPTGISIAREYLRKKSLLEDFKPRSWSSDGAHEAIRPTRPLDASELEKAILDGSLKIPVKLTRLHLALYDLIFRRFIASQMSEAEVVKTRVSLIAGGEVSEVEAVSSVVRKGFTEILNIKIESWLETLREEQELRIISSRTRKSSLSSLITSGDVVKLMKERGLGRPSTYHKAIEANKRHGYIIESKRVKALIPTKLGVSVYETVTQVFPAITSEEYTRNLEEQLDAIERGELSPVILLEEVWRSINDSVPRVVEPLAATVLARA